MHTNYQVLTNFVCFLILYFYLFSFLFILCLILYYMHLIWWKCVGESRESGGGVEQIEIDILL